MNVPFIPSSTQLANDSEANSKLPNKQTTTAQQLVRCTARRMAIGAIAITTFGLLTTITTRQIVHTVVPEIVEYVTTEAIQSLLPQ